MLQFKDPSKLRTKKIVFEDVYCAQDSGTLEQLKELSSKRVGVELINENNSITDAIAREMSGGLTSQCEQDIQKLELYLPLLENLVQHVDLIGDDLRVISWTSKLKIRWTSPLSNSSFFNLMGPRFIQIDKLQFELGIVLFFYGAQLREWASQVLVEDLVRSATLFRKAAGVYHYLAHEVLPSLQSVLTPEGPPEATTSVSLLMSLICLAEAQIVTIMKAEEKQTADGLLAKLHYGVVQLFDEAMDFYSTAAKECKDISPVLLVGQIFFKKLNRSLLFLRNFLKNRPAMCIDLATYVDMACQLRKVVDVASSLYKTDDVVAHLVKLLMGRYIINLCKQDAMSGEDYIACSKVLHELRSYKFMAQAVKTEGHIGTAIGLLKLALNKAQRNFGGVESWRTIIKQDVDTMTDLLRKCEHENEFVWHEKVPYDQHLPLLQGKKIATYIPYRPERWERTLALKI